MYRTNVYTHYAHRYTLKIISSYISRKRVSEIEKEMKKRNNIIKYLQTQHTPKPKAHCPLELPPCIRHSYTLRQTPDLLPSSDKHSSSTGTGKKLRTVNK